MMPRRRFRRFFDTPQSLAARALLTQSVEPVEPRPAIPVKYSQKAASGPLRKPAKPTGLGELHLRKLELYPSFRADLARKREIAGWSHNPWQHADTPDAIATAIAERWVDRFTNAFGQYQMLPLMGTEINIPPISDAKGFDVTGVDMVKKLNLMAQQRMASFANGAEQPYVAARTSVDDKFHGQVYPDMKEIEITTPAQSPHANILRVNRIKRIAYEGTRNYGMEYAASREGKSNKDSLVPSGPTASILAGRLPPFNIHFKRFTNGEPEYTGEHCSISFIRQPSDAHLSYANLRGTRMHNGLQNIFEHRTWQELFAAAYTTYLTADDLLACGFNPIWKDGGKEKEHAMREGHITGPATERIEIRSFNHAGSNIALTTLSMLGISQAVFKTIADDPDLRARLLTSGESPNADDIRLILGRLTSAIQPYCKAARTTDEALEIFNKHSATHHMMMEFAEHAYSSEERAALYREIEQFEEAIHARTQPSGPGKSR